MPACRRPRSIPRSTKRGCSKPIAPLIPAPIKTFSSEVDKVRVTRRSALANNRRSALANTRQNKEREPRSDSIGSEKALGSHPECAADGGVGFFGVTAGKIRLGQDAERRFGVGIEH